MVHFYKGNLADRQNTEALWNQIVENHGPIHILINNAARVLGKRVDELKIDEVELTMDINFISYVHLSMLFMAQAQIKDAVENERFHLVNVSSIAGHATC